MTHDLHNTGDGQYCFVVTADTGEVFTELQRLWDQVPSDIALQRLALQWKGEELVSLEGMDRYFFSNEAISVQTLELAPNKPPESMASGAPVLTGKILGGVIGNTAVEIYVDLSGPTPVGRKREFPANELPYAPWVFRRGIPRSTKGAA